MTAEPDAEGFNLGVEDPAGGGAGAYSPEPWMPSVNNATGPGGPQCTMDGLVVDCEIVNNLLGSGAARQCPDNDCGPRTGYLNGRPDSLVWWDPNAADAGVGYSSRSGQVVRGGTKTSLSGQT